MVSSTDQLLSEWDLLVEVRSYLLDLSNGRAWTSALTHALDDWGVVLGERGVLSGKRWLRDEHGGMIHPEQVTLDELGTYRLLGPGEVVLPSELPPLECPFVVAPLGYLALKVGWSASREEVDGLITAVVKESMGRVLGRERDTRKIFDVPCTAKKTFPLLLGKYSIDDGDVLLSREETTYVRHVIAEVRRALARDGYTADLGTFPTCHNPFRYWGEEGGRFAIVAADGSRPSQARLEAYLGRNEFEIWVFDFDQVDRLIDNVEAAVLWT
jgi:hypothetical protein